MKRKKRNQRREKMIMLGSSLLVLTALTMTGYYVKEKKQDDSSQYRVDLSQLEPVKEENIVNEESNHTVVSSAKVENKTDHTNQKEEEEKNKYPWEIELTLEDDLETNQHVKNVDIIEEENLESAQNTENKEPAFTEEDNLLWPVVGNVLINYSMDKPVYFSSLEQYKYNPAIMIQAQEGQNIHASAYGRVIKIAKEEQTGNTVYMDLGNGYEIIYGQLTNLQIKEGDYVKEGDYLADVASPTKYFSKEGCHVYFALKKDGQPVNPMTKLK